MHNKQFMKTGIITKEGKFIPCKKWEHIPTAMDNETSDQFILVQTEEINIVGSLNRKMEKSLFDFVSRNKILIDDVISSDLQDELVQ